jgi:hypothetical protein
MSTLLTITIPTLIQNYSFKPFMCADSLEVYVDASTSGGYFGFANPSKNYQQIQFRNEQNDFTIDILEIMAVGLAIEKAPPNHNLVIYTDS